MVARITFPISVSKALNYNEQKLQKAMAICIGGNGFLLTVNELNFYEKLNIFERRNCLNQRAKTKTLHVSLNFSPIEYFSTEKLNEIAQDYIQLIGFADQPYFVYQHLDAGHPHIHILASAIRADGTRINTHNIGRNQSEFARKFVEEKYQLIKAEKQAVLKTVGILPFNLEKIQYGKSETLKGIATAVHSVTGSYNYTSLPELNAVLRQFNVLADRGQEGSFTYRKNGLIYHLLDRQGAKIGVPIKASTIPGNPGLHKLEKKFAENKKKREPLRVQLKKSIDESLLQSPDTITALASLLKEKNITVITRVNETGRIYGITFVDNGNRSVFNGSQISKAYSVSGLLKQMQTSSNLVSKPVSYKRLKDNKLEAGKELVEFNGVSLVAELIKPIEDNNLTPYQFKKRKKKIRH